MQLDSSVESILLEPFMPNTIASNVVIAEMLYDATGADTSVEWILLYNPTDSPIDLTGWRLQVGGGGFGNHGSNMPIAVGNIIAPFSYFLIGGGGVPGTDYVSNTSFQNGGGDTDGVRIIDNLGNTIDTILYDSPNGNTLPDNTGNIGNSFAPDVDNNSGDSLQRKSDSTGYVSGQGNGYQTNASGNDFIIKESGGVPIVPRNSTSPSERFTGEINEGNNYLPTFVNTSKRGPSTSLGFWQIGSNEQHGFTHAPVFKMVFTDIADVITQGAPEDPGVSAPLNEISGIKIWGVGNTNDDGVVFPLSYLSNNPKLDIYLNKFQFVDNDGEARLPIERTDISGPPHGGAPVNFNITGYKKKTFPITF